MGAGDVSVMFITPFISDEIGTPVLPVARITLIVMEVTDTEGALNLLLRYSCKLSGDVGNHRHPRFLLNIIKSIAQISEPL